MEDIDLDTSIFSYIFINNLSALKNMFKSNIINRSSDVYKKHLTCFIMFLKKQNIINDIDNGFINFYNWAMNNGYKEGLTIERINVNGNYEPSNCTWIPLGEQNRNKTNTKRNKICK